MRLPENASEHRAPAPSEVQATAWLNDGPLAPWQRWALVVFFGMFLAFGVLVEIRSAFLKQRLGDFRVFAQAAWAVRAGQDIYDIKVDGRWHYCYPPLLAIVLTRLADPPAGVDRAGMLPFATSVGLWYGLSLACLFFAVHVLARALEEYAGTPGPQRFGKRWWAFRIWPILICLVPIGHTLMRGQVNLLVLALLCASLSALVREKRFQAGLWLSGAICIKIFPAFLLLYPACRRDVRMFSGCLLGLFIGLLAIPAVYLGPAPSYQMNRKLAEVMILPGLGLGPDQSRAEELINVTATDSQSILAALHNTLHLDRTTRPKDASTGIRLASWIIGGLLTLATLWAGARRKENRDGLRVAIFFGLLILVMLFLSPVCHLHYYCLALPLVMGLMAASSERRVSRRAGWGTTLLLGAFLLCTIPSQFPGCDVLRDIGLSLYGGLLLWLAGVRLLLRNSSSVCSAAEEDGKIVGIAA